MSLTIYRATVKGRFDDLDEAARARLSDELADHDVLVAGGYTEDGSLTYDRALDFFRYRVQVRAEGDEPEAEAVERGHAEAQAPQAPRSRRGGGGGGRGAPPPPPRGRGAGARAGPGRARPPRRRVPGPRRDDGGHGLDVVAAVGRATARLNRTPVSGA